MRMATTPYRRCTATTAVSLPLPFPCADEGWENGGKDAVQSGIASPTNECTSSDRCAPEDQKTGSCWYYVARELCFPFRGLSQKKHGTRRLPPSTQLTKCLTKKKRARQVQHSREPGNTTTPKRRPPRKLIGGTLDYVKGAGKG